MEIRKANLLQQFIIPFVFFCMTLTGFLLPVSAYSDSTNSETSTLANDSVSKKLNSKQSTPLTHSSTDRKKILIDDSRGLSAFFILGIVINIIMVITFAWWFSSEWRKTKK